MDKETTLKELASIGLTPDDFGYSELNGRLFLNCFIEKNDEVEAKLVEAIKNRNDNETLDIQGYAISMNAPVMGKDFLNFIARNK